jgi:hypothetical protein
MKKSILISMLSFLFLGTAVAEEPRSCGHVFNVSVNVNSSGYSSIGLVVDGKKMESVNIKMADEKFSDYVINMASSIIGNKDENFCCITTKEKIEKLGIQSNENVCTKSVWINAINLNSLMDTASK